MIGRFVGDKLRRIWKEVVVALFEVESHYVLRRTVKDHKCHSPEGLTFTAVNIHVVFSHRL
jgi:hypothetical protein